MGMTESFQEDYKFEIKGSLPTGTMRQTGARGRMGVGGSVMHSGFRLRLAAVSTSGFFTFLAGSPLRNVIYCHIIG
jgi:hypothetical protein